MTIKQCSVKVLVLLMGILVTVVLLVTKHGNTMDSRMKTLVNKYYGSPVQPLHNTYTDPPMKTLPGKYKTHLQNIAIHLSKVVESTWRTPEAQIEARNALKLTQAALAEFVIELSLTTVANATKGSPQNKTGKPLVVCPEKYLGTNIDYPWFEKARVLTNCTNAPPFPSILSILLNGFDYSDQSQLVVILREIYATYPRLTVHLAVAEKIVIPEEVKLDVHQHIFGQNPASNDIWNGLAEKATTDYVLVGRRIERFQWYALLERMVRVLSELGVDAVGGSLRTPDGHWSMGCHQTRLRNYTLTYRDGYLISRKSCVYCDYIPSPFVSRTSILRTVQFKMTSTNTVFHDYFLRLQKDRKLVMSCPDAMFYVLANNKSMSSLHKQWIPMIQKYAINHVNLADGTRLSFSCKEAKTSFSWAGGVIVPVCAVESLLKGILDAMDICRKIGLFCHLDGGTTLGAMKFNGILPWERDADLSYVTSKNITFWEHRDEFTKLGYKLSLKYPEKCRKFDRNNERCGHYDLVIPHWRIELWGATPRLMTDFLRENRIESTKLLIGGRWMNAPTNPGLNSRNRYGYELWKHAEHWITLGYSTSWVPYHGGRIRNVPNPEVTCAWTNSFLPMEILTSSTSKCSQ
ncbi:hypothetical protein NP493_2730g00004 [Ridgeia piscesae]|uniref:Uncharacterized protein n=1 Tax=Ridgeia piscesae TaxID=27915 RepID=A0AAD9N0R4_RIDPI|nr:hypothetical protein NP493_2730g00004 [Ridgeia piscesae]